MKVKAYFSTIALLIFSHLQTKNLKKIHRPEAEILAHKVGKYEKVTVD